MRYKTGEEIKDGDRVLFHQQEAEIEYVAERATGNEEMDWNLRENGAGVMILEPREFGRVYVRNTENLEHLVFVGRSSGNS